MWLLPFEKLPPLVLGPLMILFGIIAFLVPYIKNFSKELEDLIWSVVIIAGGIAVTAYGIWDQLRDDK